ncbi:MAG: MBL fold metallo-hydrolase [Candidatus Tectomicrobia bacterium]|nr:MBL fold metallo-hydrolase [Candidatus Tectomicrobia bacterium]
MKRRQFLSSSARSALTFRFLGWVSLTIVPPGCRAYARAQNLEAFRHRLLQKPQPAAWSDDEITIAWVGHASFLINFYGTTILTDPVFSRHIGVSLMHRANVGPKRLISPALKLSELPALDLILVSHAHMDHYDLPTLHRLKKRKRETPLVLARETSDLANKLGFQSVEELDWSQSLEVDGITIEAVEVKHWGRRHPWDQNNRGYNGYLLSKNGRTLLFGGDTAYTETFEEIAQDRQIDVAMLPIGAYNPYIRNHASPEQTWEMFKGMRATYLIPMHWGTFILSQEPVFEPITRLRSVAGRETERVVIQEIGQTWTLPEGANHDPHLLPPGGGG